MALRSKNFYRDMANRQPVSYAQGVAGLHECLDIIVRFYNNNGRWPTIKEKPPYSWQIKRIVEHYRRICDAHGVTLYEFLTATESEFDIVWEKLSHEGRTSTAEQQGYAGSIAEAMEKRISDAMYANESVKLDAIH